MKKQDVFNLLGYLTSKISTQIEIDNIEVSFKLDKHKEKDIAITVFYIDPKTGSTRNFTEHYFNIDSKKVSIERILADLNARIQLILNSSTEFTCSI